MADCGDYEYQATEYRGLFDLKDAQVVRAEIVSIDSSLNTAEVTLLDDCLLFDWADLTAVPFFYHCEDSAGTVEDLARGHRAFDVSDMVYILAYPEKGELPAHAYIVGHVDQRGTTPCGDEYFTVSAVVGSGETTVTVRTIVNVVTGSIFDLASFVDKAGSPARPESIPFVDSTGWFAYNFTIPEQDIYVLPFTVTRHDESDAVSDEVTDYVSNGFITKTVDSSVAYTGDSYKGYPRTCSDVSLGNGTSSDTDTYDGTYSVTGIYVYQNTESLFNSAGKAPYSSGCWAYFGSSEYKHDVRYEYPSGTSYVSIYDSRTGLTNSIQFMKVESESFEVGQTCADSLSTVTATYSIETSYSASLSAFSGGTFTLVNDYSWSATGEVRSPPDFFVEDINAATSGSCSVDTWVIPNMRFNGVAGDGLSALNLFGGTEYENSIAIGEKYVCTVWGGFFYTEFNTPVMSGATPVSVFAAEFSSTGTPWGSSGAAAYINSSGYTYTATPVVFATVTPVASLSLVQRYEAEPYNRFTITDCLGNTDSNKSIALSSAVSGLISFVQSTISDSSDFTEVLNAFQYLHTGGLTIYPVKTS